jgi:hypothetical protein
MSGSTCPTGCEGMSCGCRTESIGATASRATTLKILPSGSIRPILRERAESRRTQVSKLMTDLVEQEKWQMPKKSSWWWPGGVATTLAGAAAMAFRGCWHSRMSWPVGAQGYSYQVCLSCGAKRLFDEKTLCAYGPFRDELNELIVWQRSRKTKSEAESEVNARRPS